MKLVLLIKYTAEFVQMTSHVTDQQASWNVLVRTGGQVNDIYKVNKSLFLTVKPNLRGDSLHARRVNADVRVDVTWQAI